MGEVSFKLGPAVRDGQVRFVSVSQIESFDPAAYGGCHRRWWFRRVARAQEPQGRPAALGEQVHLQLEDYLRTGHPEVLGEIAKAGRLLLPEPGPDLKLEWAFGEATADGGVSSPLTLAGVPLIGKVDLAHCRDPRRAVVVDHKTTRRIHDTVDPLTGAVTRRGLAKSPDEVANTWQMRAYAALAVLEWPQVEDVKVEHVYYQTEWPWEAVARGRVVDAAGAMGRFLEAEPLVEDMKKVARLKVVTDVEPNPDSCSAFGGCPHRDRCPRSVESVLVGLFKKEESKMGLLQRRREEKAAAATAPSDDLVAEEVQKLVAEEAAAKSGPTEAGPQVLPPDAPEPRDVAQAEEAPAPDAAPGKCAESGAMARLAAGEDESKVHKCKTCGALLKARPKRLGDGFFYSLVPEHEPGVDGAKISTAGKKREPKRAAEAPAQVPADDDVVGVNLFIDSIEDGLPYRRLEAYAQRLADELAAANGAADIRCAPEKSALAFGKWRGAFEAAVRAAPPEPGNYLVAGSAELGRVAFEALSTMGLGRVVRGAK